MIDEGKNVRPERGESFYLPVRRADVRFEGLPIGRYDLWLGLEPTGYGTRR